MSIQTHQSQCLRSALAFGLAAVVVYAGLPIGANGATTHYGEHACDERVQVKDYLAPIEEAAPVRGVPESGVLPFAPPGLSLQRLGNGPQVGPGRIGFAFHDEALNWPRRLNWVIKARLVKVNAKGHVMKVVRRKTERIGTRKIEYETVTGQRFGVPGNPALYRVDLDFENIQGRKLGRYSEYFRVMKGRYQVIMTLSDTQVAFGQTLRARIENLGTEPVTADLGLAIEKRDGNRWVHLATVYDRGKRVDGRTYVFGGETGPCFSYKVPADLGSGTFRVSEEIRRYLKGGQRRHATSAFQVSDR